MTQCRTTRPRIHRWTPAQLASLAATYAHELTATIAGRIGRTERSCYAKAHELGLKKSPEFLASKLSGRLATGTKHANMVATQFRPGQAPWNKGTSFQAGGRSALTRFKPGQKPVTQLPLGSYRVVHHHSGNSHLQQKTSDTSGANHKRWTPVSRMVWEAAHGPVPPGHVVVFKPDQHALVLELITLDRVECISRAQLAVRNHPANKSPELAKLVQLKGAITRQVNRINREAAQAGKQATP